MVCNFRTIFDMTMNDSMLYVGVLIVAVLYASVGHAGASGYIAVMSLLTYPVAQIRTTALLLNVVVAMVASWQFIRAGHWRQGLLWPFAITALPMAYIGSRWHLPAAWLQLILAAVLVYAALRFSIFDKADTGTDIEQNRHESTSRPPLYGAMLSGTVMGLLAGLTGTGGGIFLTPLLLIMGWAPAKPAAAASAVFILLNSLAGLAGVWPVAPQVWQHIPGLIFVALLGGLLGSKMGSRHWPALVIKRLLAVVMMIAAVKLLITLG